MNKGVTLVEIMIVVSILGILGAVTLPKYSEAVRKSKEGSTKTSLVNMRSALLLYFADNIGVDPSTLTAIVPDYIDAIPSASLGKWHSDSSSIINASTYGVINQTDLGGWYYVTPSGKVVINCTHTDTKQAIITSW